jgi:aldehyde:ferredoxin oxidoreductase
MMDNWDPASLLYLNSLCDQLGLDTISMGVTLSFACECFEKGLITEKETGGKALRFGDSALIAELVQDTAKRQGFGNLLAEGSYRLAERIGKGSQDLLYCFKKVEVAGHSARALKGMSVGYATGTRGGSHHDARPTLQYMGEFDRTKTDRQALFAVKTQNFTAMNDSLTQCRFASERGYGGTINDNYMKMINSVTGWGLSLADVEKVGDGIYNLERAFNCREGIRRQDDTIPARTLNQPIPAGPSKGMYTPRVEFEAMLNEYYQLRGWDAKGVPTIAKLKELGLAEIGKDFPAAG